MHAKGAKWLYANFSRNFGSYRCKKHVGYQTLLDNIIKDLQKKLYELAKNLIYPI